MLLPVTRRSLVALGVLLLAGSMIGGSLAVRDPAALYALLPVGFGYTAERVDRLWSSEKARAEFTVGNSLYGQFLVDGDACRRCGALPQDHEDRLHANRTKRDV